MTKAKTKKRELLLPTSLEVDRGGLAKALEVAVPAGEWPKELTYQMAEQPAAIGHVLRRSYHAELEKAAIAYLFKERLKSKGREVGGKASKSGAKLQALSGYDFVLEFNWWAWRGITPEQRIALVDHEMEHCTTDDETGAWTTTPHDVEEFFTIYSRWGAWTPNLRAWGSIEPQLELVFDSDLVK